MLNLVSLALSVTKISKVGHVTQATPLLTQFNIFCLVPIRFLLRAKFGLSSYVLYGDMAAVPKFKK